MFLVLAVSHALAESPPKIVSYAFDTYKTKGFEEAFKVLLKGSPMESDKTTLMNMKGGFTQIETMYGKMIGYEILKSIKISNSTIRTFAEVRYEKGPVFVFIDSYNSPNGWINPVMRLHTDAEKILPEAILFKEVK
jgi:hypothetical protein